jgi:hypothetical protein
VADALPPEYLTLSRKDQQVVELLVAHGADLRAPRHVLSYLYVRSEDDQFRAASAVARLGWKVSIPPPLPESPDSWLVRGERPDLVLSPGAVLAMSESFETLAAQFGGEYDG